MTTFKIQDDNSSRHQGKGNLLVSVLLIHRLASETEALPSHPFAGAKITEEKHLQLNL